MTQYPEKWAVLSIDALNQFSSRTIDPSKTPNQWFELYSVPSSATGKPEIVQGKQIGSTKISVAPGDVLVCKINPRINRVWSVAGSEKHPQIASSEWIVVRTPKVDSRYLKHYFSSPKFRELICQDLTGVGGSLTRAQPKRVATFPVPVPTSNEQKRIADKLDTVLTRVDAVNDRLARVAPLLKRFRQSVLAAAMSGRLTAPEDPEVFPESPLHELAEMRLGKMLDKAKNRGESASYLRNVNVRWFQFDLEDLLEMRIEAHERENLSVRDGDVLICEGGEPGRCAVWRHGPTALIFQKALHRARTNSEKLLPEWLVYCLKHQADSGALQALFTGSTIKHLTGAGLARVQIPLPSVVEQTEIIRRADLLFAYADRLEARLQAAQTAAERLTPALLAKAFRGELVPQDPNDEPAAELLRRLKENTSGPAAPARKGRGPGKKSA